jgi:hypothetical protein
MLEINDKFKFHILLARKTQKIFDANIITHLYQELHS